MKYFWTKKKKMRVIDTILLWIDLTEKYFAINYTFSHYEKPWHYHITVWKNEEFSLTKEIFRQIKSLIISLVKPLFSRNFCQKCVRLNRSNFHTAVHISVNFYEFSCQPDLKAASVAANVARSSCDRTAISVEVRVPAAATKPGSFLVRGEEKALTTSKCV